MAWLEGWSNRVKITVKAAKVGGATLTDYPVYVNMAALPAAFWTDRVGYTDVAITTSDEVTPCPRDIGYYDVPTTTGELYFKAPSCSHLADTDFYLYYGNESATEVNDAATWSSYDIVYLFNESPSETVGCLVNHAANANHMEGASGLAAVYEASDMFVAGKFGKAWKTRAGGTIGSREWIQKASAINFTEQSLSVTVWGNIADVTVTGGVFTCTNSFGNGWGLSLGAEALDVFTGNYTSYAARSIAGLNDTWIHLGGVHIHGGTTTAYVNGAGTTAAGQDITASTGRCGFGGSDIGVATNFAQWYNGLFSQARVSTTAKTAAWILGEYNNTSDPATFYEIGAVEDEPPAPVGAARQAMYVW